MYILCKQQTVNLPSMAKGCAKYVYKNLDGSFKVEKDSTGWVVYSTILYAIPQSVVKRYGFSDDEVNELDIRIDFKTYADKLRVEVIELRPDEKTIMFKTLKESTFNNVQEGYQTVLGLIKKSIQKEFQDYDILF